MNKTNITLIVLIIFASLHDCYAQHKDSSQESFINSCSLLVEKAAFYIKKHAAIIALAPLVIAYHKDIFRCMMNRPCISSLGLYCLLHYSCDSILHYQQQKALLELIAVLKEITLCLVISHGIKNHMHQKNICIEPFFDDQFFLNNITNNLEYSFQEVTTITLTSYQELKSTLQSFNHYLDIESEEFVFLCYASFIDIDNLLYLTHNDLFLHQAVYAFEKDPKNNTAQLLEFIKSKITTAFIKLEKNLLHNDIHACLA